MAPDAERGRRHQSDSNTGDKKPAGLRKSDHAHQNGSQGSQQTHGVAADPNTMHAYPRMRLRGTVLLGFHATMIALFIVLRLPRSGNPGCECNRLFTTTKETGALFVVKYVK